MFLVYFARWSCGRSASRLCGSSCSPQFACISEFCHVIWCSSLLSIQTIIKLCVFCFQEDYYMCYSSQELGDDTLYISKFLLGRAAESGAALWSNGRIIVIIHEEPPPHPTPTSRQGVIHIFSLWKPSTKWHLKNGLTRFSLRKIHGNDMPDALPRI